MNRFYQVILVVSTLGLSWLGMQGVFGIGDARGRVSRRAALGTLAVLLIVVVVELLADGRILRVVPLPHPLAVESGGVTAGLLGE